MTTEEAINILADGGWWNYLDNFAAVKSEPRKELVDALDMAIAALRAQQERENPKPLTLDELREMDGELVWVEHYNGGEYVIVAWNIYDEIAGARQARLATTNYGSDGFTGWLAYHNKPKEG